ncbi:MAG: hypothetical protein M3Y36_01960 [Actinomycetota bacterium]|nr:hypothetical protein [Actinomycetota bacterium]
MAHDTHILLIPGTSSLTHLADNLATATVHLTAETMQVLDGLAESQS